MILELSIFLITAYVLTKIWLKWTYEYFKRNNVPYITPSPFFGNLRSSILGKQSIVFNFNDLYNHEDAKDQPYVGFYLLNKRGILVRDPELIKRVLIKDFNWFTDRNGTSDPHYDVIGAYNLFFIKNPGWKKLRTSLTSFFTSGKLKNSCKLVMEAGDELNSFLANAVEKRTPDWDGLDFKDLCARYTTDVIATVAFGIKANSIKNPNAGFRMHGAKLTKFTLKRALEFNTILMFPKLASLLRLQLISGDSNEFFRSSINHIIDEREKSNIKRSDLIDMLIDLKKSGDKIDEHNSFAGDVLVAQAALFFIAGFETSSATMSFTLYHIAMSSQIQETVRNEIKAALKKTNGEITYDAISEMEYLSAIIFETTRLYPATPFLDRQCTPENGEKGYSLDPYGDYVVPKGMGIYIPIYPIHTDPKYFSDPLTYKPERFLAKNKADIIPGTYLGFGSGQRNCIGERLAILLSKIGLVNILKNYRIAPSKKTPMVIKFDPRAPNSQIEGRALYLDIIKDKIL